VATNIGFDDGHPYFELGADDGNVSIVDGRIAFFDTAATPSTVTVERSDDGGLTWTPVLGETPAEAGASFMDWQSASYADILYRATAVNTEGAAAVTEITVQARSGALWLSGGSGFGVTCRLPFDPQVKVTAGRERALKQWAGRTKPVTLVGEAVSRVIEVSGSTADRAIDSEETASVEALTRLAQNPEAQFLYRDPDGRRIFGVVPEIGMSRNGSTGSTSGWNGLWGYSLTLTESD